MSYEEVRDFRSTGNLPMAYHMDGCPCEYMCGFCILHDGWKFDSAYDKEMFDEQQQQIQKQEYFQSIPRRNSTAKRKRQRMMCKTRQRATRRAAT